MKKRQRMQEGGLGDQTPHTFTYIHDKLHSDIFFLWGFTVHVPVAQLRYFDN